MIGLVAQLDEPLRQALIPKLYGKHKGPWGRFKRAVVNSLGRPDKVTSAYKQPGWFER